MPRSMNMITYGKITIGSEQPLEYIRETLGYIIKTYGYPEAGLMNKEDVAKAEADFKNELAKLDEQSRPVQGGQDGRAPPYKVQQPGRKQQPVKSEGMY